jgi:very-short-patch-repair endonuclease
MVSEETKKKISESMKKAHKEGRAWNIGKSRWNNEPSYPEKFWMRVIKNEFDDKSFKREFPCGVYSIDFAWPHKMLAIEIDGEQHQRFQENRKRDERKDGYLEKTGWKLLRIDWKECCADPHQWINIAKSFIDNGEIVSFEKRYKTKKECLKEKALEKIESGYVRYGRTNWKERVDMILSCGVDLTKFGWVKKVCEKTGLNSRMIWRSRRYLPKYVFWRQ